MIKYKVTDYISYRSGDISKYLFPGDELVFIEEFNSYKCGGSRKTFAQMSNKEEVIIYHEDFDKIELIDEEC